MTDTMPPTLPPNPLVQIEKTRSRSPMGCNETGSTRPQSYNTRENYRYTRHSPPTGTCTGTSRERQRILPRRSISAPLPSGMSSYYALPIRDTAATHQLPPPPPRTHNNTHQSSPQINISRAFNDSSTKRPLKYQSIHQELLIRQRVRQRSQVLRVKDCENPNGVRRIRKQRKQSEGNTRARSPAGAYEMKASLNAQGAGKFKGLEWMSNSMSTTLLLGAIGMFLLREALDLFLEDFREAFGVYIAHSTLQFPFFLSTEHGENPPLQSILLLGAGLSLIGMVFVDYGTSNRRSLGQTPNDASTIESNSTMNPLWTVRVTTWYGMTLLALQQAWVEWRTHGSMSAILVWCATASFLWVLGGYDAFDWSQELRQHQRSQKVSQPEGLLPSADAWDAHRIQQRILRAILSFWLVPMTFVMLFCPSQVLRLGTDAMESTDSFLGAVDAHVDGGSMLPIRLFGLLQFGINWVLVLEWLEDDKAFAKRHLNSKQNKSTANMKIGLLLLCNMALIGIPTLTMGAAFADHYHLRRFAWYLVAAGQSIVSTWTILALYYGKLSSTRLPAQENKS